MTLGELRNAMNKWMCALTDDCEIKLSDNGNLRDLSLPLFVVTESGEGKLVVEALDGRKDYL